MKLRFIQRFGAGCNIENVLCDDDCASRAIALYANDDNSALALCEKHRQKRNAPVPPDGVEYLPTMALMDKWHMKDGKPCNDPRLPSRFKPSR